MGSTGSGGSNCSVVDLSVGNTPIWQLSFSGYSLHSSLHGRSAAISKSAAAEGVITSVCRAGLQREYIYILCDPDLVALRIFAVPEVSVAAEKAGVKIPILDPLFKKLVINECLGIPGAVAPGKTVTLDKVTYLIKGNPAEVERLAYQSKVQIIWEEGGKKWEKVVSVTPERQY